LNTLIYGAGAAGIALSSILKSNHKYNLVGFLDDDISLSNNYINGYLVIHPNDLERFIEIKKVSTLILAMPSIKQYRKNEIFNSFILKNIRILSLPSLNEFNDNIVKISDIKEIDIDNLIKRKSIEPEKQLLKKNIINQTVLVSGAGGSIGFELSQQITFLKCNRIILLDMNEYNLYKIKEALENIQIHSNIKIETIAILGSVCDKKLVEVIIKKYTPHTIFHAAAYKHVNIVEENKKQGIINNIIGTFNLAKTAYDFGIQNFILISSDKAVRPTNLMGATKRISEMIVQSIAEEIKIRKGHKSIFSMVRFGNVIGSSGSVIPKFTQQIKNGGPLTLTHKNITRYFMTLNEAVELVIQASSLAKGGEVFILDMNEPIKILDIALRLIKSFGYSINEETLEGDISIIITGLKPGEKLYEELLINKNAISTKHPNIFKAKEPFISYSEINEMIKSIKKESKTIHNNKMIKINKKLVPEYIP